MNRDFYVQYFQLEKKHWWFLARRKIILNFLETYTPQKKKHGALRILDVGCGSGNLVDELARRGYATEGCDTFESAIAFGIENGIKNLRVIKTESVLPFSDKTYDIVLVLDVLEHLKNESLMLREINRVLTPNGILIATVPAFSFLWGTQDIISHHYRRYTKKEFLNKIAQNFPSTVLRVTYFNTLLFFPIMLIRLLSKVKKTTRKSDFEIHSEILNGFFYFVFSLERYWLRFFNFPFGVSLLAVVKKNKS